jgi:branched-chain amino acid transport system substrate-binding protein
LTHIRRAEDHAAVNGAAAVLVVVLGVFAAACAGGDDPAEPVATSSCAQLLYEGDGEPDVIAVSDLPRRGIGGKTAKLMIDAIEFVLRERDFRAGEHRVGYQACNDTVGEEPFDEGLCRRNARAYVATDDVVGIIGPWNSACALGQIPIVSAETAGPLAMVSPATTYEGLTRNVPGEPSGQDLYPDGVRSFARVVTHSLVQGSATAHLAASVGARRALVLHQDLANSYVRGNTVPFVKTAKGLGLEVVQVEWPLRRSYTKLAAEVAGARPDVVFLCCETQTNAKTLVEDLRAALPPDVRLIAPDSFAYDYVARDLGPAGEGMLVTLPGVPAEELPPAGKAFVEEFGQPAFVERGFLGAPEAAQAAEVLLDAIARSDGTRASVVEELFATNVENGILGSFRFDRFGDIDPAPVGVYRYEGGKIVVEGVVRAPLEAGG